MTTAYDRVTERLIAVTGYAAPRPGADWRCPNAARHRRGDKRPSLSVTPGTDKVLIRCQGGCSIGEVLAALELVPGDLYDDRGSMHSNGNSGNGSTTAPRSEIDAVYTYTSAAGVPVFEVVRYRPKRFAQRVPDVLEPSGYRWSTAGIEKPLYRLPALLAAVAEGRRIWIVEGEKDVEALERAGEVATCNAGGAGKWRPEYVGLFTGAEVHIVADLDNAGRIHALDIARSLEGVAGSVRVVEAAFGKDAAEHLGAGYGVEDFRLTAPIDEAGTNTTDDFLAPDSDAQGVVSRPFKRVGLDISSKPEPRPTIGRYLYKGGFTVFQSEAGVGKTWLALAVLLDIIRSGGVVLYFDEEGGDDLMRERLYALGASQADIAERFWYFPFEARVWDDDDLVALRAIISEAAEVGPIQLAVFDSLPDFLAAAGLSEDSAKDVTTFVNRVCGTFREYGIAQAALDHLVKPPTSVREKKERSRYSRGSGAKLAKADATILIETAEAFDTTTSGRLRVWKTKDRYGRLDVPRMDEPGRILDVVVDAGTVRIGDSSAPITRWQGPTACMSRITEVLRERAAGLTFNKLDEVVPFARATVKSGIDELARQGVVKYANGPRNSIVWRLDDNIEQIYLDLVDDGDDTDE